MRYKRWNLVKIQRKKRQKFMVMLIIAAFLIVPFYPGTFTFAGYVYTKLVKSYIATSEADFYFTSDLLSDAAEVPVYQINHDWATAATINFELRNYENQLNVSDRPITYSVSAEPAGGSAGGTIVPNGTVGQRRPVRLTVPVPANPAAPLEVLVTAVSSRPYAKTLQGRFVILPAISFSVADNSGSPVATLTLALSRAAQSSRNVTIGWQEGAVPDMTNPLVLNAASIDLVNRTLTTSLHTASVYELIFFKDSPEGNYTAVTATGA